MLTSMVGEITAEGVVSDYAWYFASERPGPKIVVKC